MYFAYRPKKKLREFLVLRGEIPQESTISSSLLVSTTLLAKLVFIHLLPSNSEERLILLDREDENDNDGD